MPRDLRQMLGAQARVARERHLALLEGDGGRAAQDETLTRLLAANADTVFGREHGFAGLRDLDGYRAAVPLRHYDELEPWIDRAAAGEPAVLTREDPVRFWKTTGTTSKAKKIPITPSAAARVAESFLALQGTQLHYHPDVMGRADAYLMPHLSPRPVTELLAGRFPYCSTTEAPVDVKPGREDLLPPWLLPLSSVALDEATRLYFLLCYAAGHDLLAIGCLHPSRFQTVVTVLHEQWPRLLRELHDGTILGSPVREGRPGRARDLEAIAAREGTLLPRDVWPHLELLTSWSGGYMARYRPVMEHAYARGPIDFLAMPSISSECFMTLTVDKDPIAQPLNPRGGVFEFVPSAETVGPSTRTLLPHEVRAGETYEIVLTTLGGLYRYAMCDLFRVTGFVGRVPRLEYLGRRAVADLTGEKLAEEQVAGALPPALLAAGVAALGATLCAVQDLETGHRSRYVLALECTPPPPPARLAELARDLDERLQLMNSRYKMKRSFGDLDPLAVELLAPGAFTRYRELLARRGMPAGQIKERVLHASGAAVLADLRAGS